MGESSRRAAARELVIEVFIEMGGVADAVGSTVLDRLPDRGKPKSLPRMDGDVEILPMEELERVEMSFRPPGSGRFDDDDRNEYSWLVEVALERPINDVLTASLRYSYFNNDSNLRDYDYDQNIVGLYFTIQFPR